MVGVAAGAMVDRVPHGLGLVGEVDDVTVMASNIMTVLQGNLAEMGRLARAHALQFSWDQSMERLFGRVYRSALARASLGPKRPPKPGRERWRTPDFHGREAAVDAPYAIVEQLEPGVARLLARNPSPFTYFGTCTYLVGEGEVVVVDPGPDLPEHVEAIVAALDGRNLAAIACTHTHRDHSPASRALKEATGAPIIGCAPLVLESIGPRADASFDKAYAPDQVVADGEAIEFDGGKRLVAVATPGHTSNHLCFAFGDALFTGDHVMGWSTTVVVPPDGDMAAYMRSMELLRQRKTASIIRRMGPR